MKNPLGILVVVAVGVLIGAESSQAAFSSTPTSFDWGTNGTVYAIASGSDNTMYFGGTFTQVGRSAAFAMPFSTSTGSASAETFPAFSTDVYSAVADGEGGWYVGGNFTLVGSVTRNRLAHVLSDGSLDPDFNPNMSSSVTSLVLSPGGTTLYAGGNFTTVNGGTTRNYIAALDPTTGTASTSFDIGTILSEGPLTMALSEGGTTLFAGGDFTEVDGNLAHNRLVALDRFTGVASSGFTPNFNDNVESIAVFGSTIYAGGGFTTVGSGTTRNYLAALDISTGATTSFDPNADSWAFAVAISPGGTTVYAGGYFENVNSPSVARTRLAAFDATTGVASASFDPNVDQTLNALAVSADGATLYAAGEFVTVNGATTRNRIAAFDTATGTATSFDPDLNFTVRTLVLEGSELFAGGQFTLVNQQPRNNLFAIDVGADVITSFHPNMSSTVRALVLDGTTLYAGGAFTTGGGESRNRLAALDIATGLATSFDPNMDNEVRALVLDGTTLYAGGLFSTGGGESRTRLAALDTTTGLATSFNPSFDSNVLSLALDGTTLYAGGGFSTAGGESRNRLVALDTTTGLATSFNPNMNSAVYSLAIRGSTLYAGGDFTTVNGGVSRPMVAAFEIPGDGTTTDFDPGGPTNTAFAVAIAGPTLYGAGDFNTVLGQTRFNIFGKDTSTTDSSLTSFNPRLLSFGYAITVAGTKMYVGGVFGTANYLSHKSIAVFDYTNTGNPVITRTGAATVSVAVGTTYTDAGATATDADDGDITDDIVTTNPVNTSVPGTYTVTYTVTDFGGATDTQTRTVTVVSTGSVPLGPWLSPPPVTPGVPAVTPAQYGLQEGDTISAPGSNDPDIYIINDWGYKRLFLNPVIFNFYGHLGGWSAVNSETPTIRDAFITSGLFRNCETDATEVYAVEVTGEDTGTLHHVNLTGEQAVAQDVNFFKKVFCINSNEEQWYPKSPTPYSSLSQVPVYSR